MLPVHAPTYGPLAPMPHRKPYNPASSGPQVQVHDRRATQVNRGLAAHLVATEIEDPFAKGERIIAMRSVRGDPLADHLARGHIDAAQFEAGRAFQRYFGHAERGPRSMQLTERVDGDPPREGLTDNQIKAWQWLAKSDRALGIDGSALVHDMLISARTAKQVAESRGLTGQEWQRYFAKRFWKCLNTLAVVYGFSSGEKKIRASGTKTQIIGVQ